MFKTLFPHISQYLSLLYTPRKTKDKNGRKNPFVGTFRAQNLAGPFEGLANKMSHMNKLAEK